MTQRATLEQLAPHARHILVAVVGVSALLGAVVCVAAVEVITQHRKTHRHKEAS